MFILFKIFKIIIIRKNIVKMNGRKERVAIKIERCADVNQEYAI
jgi:hypothetical protein